MGKEENKGRLGPQQQGGEAQGAGALSELLCDIPPPLPQGTGAQLFPLFTNINLPSPFSIREKTT